MTELHRDHRNIASLLDLLETEIGKLSENAQPDYQLINEILDYMADYPDLHHHPLEDLVYNRYLKVCAPESNRITDLQAEHKKLSTLTETLGNRLKMISVGQVVARDEIVAAAQEYIAEQRHHMKLEEQEIFPAIESCFSEKEWKALAKQLAKRQSDPLFNSRDRTAYSRLYEHIVK
jgi:hemerythrin-like domain-containing protein